MTPLHEACTRVDLTITEDVGVAAVIQLLIKAGADGRAVDHEGNTTLHFLCKRMKLTCGIWGTSLKNIDNLPVANGIRRFETIATWLIDAGVDVESRNADGHTAIHVLMNTNGLKSESAGAWRVLVQPMAGSLVSAGCRSWDAVPTPCNGIERALLPLWKKHPEDLCILMSRLKEDLKPVLRTFLICLHHHLPGHPELQIEILAMGLNDYNN